MAPEEQVQCRLLYISTAVFLELIQLCQASECFGATFHLLWNKVTGPQTKWAWHYWKPSQRKVCFLAFINTYRGQVLCSAAQKQYYPKAHCGHPLRTTSKNYLKAFLKSCLPLLSILQCFWIQWKVTFTVNTWTKNLLPSVLFRCKVKKRNSNTQLLDSLAMRFPIQKVTWFCFQILGLFFL